MTRSVALQSITTIVRGTSVGVHLRDTLKLANWAWITVLAALGLCLVGVYAIDVSEGAAGAGLAATAWRQLVFVIVGLIATVVVVLPHYRVVQWFSWAGYLACIALLVYLLVPFAPLVTPRNGARAWIDFGPADFQPSEVTKVAYVLVVAGYLRFRTGHRQLRGWVVPGIITAVPVGLITLQPDLGTACLYVPALFAVLIAAGARKRHLTIIVLGAALAAPAASPFLRPHQKARLVGLAMQLKGDRSAADDVNYQSFTAQTLIGAGGLTGASEDDARALIQHNHLPESHNDMIFAVIVTRFGLLGGLGVLALYLLWVVGALLTASGCRDPAGRLICVGLAAFMAAQMVINVGMNVGVLPIIGITLPYVSYGGSSMLTSWIMAGLVLSVGLHRTRPPFRESFEYADDDGPPQHIPGGFRSVGLSGRAVTR